MSQDLPEAVADLEKKVDALERISIKVNTDPVVALYLKPVVQVAVDLALLTYPTQTYSNSSPSGTAPSGSIWFYDTGVLATREIHVYNGGWIRFK